MVRLWKCYLVMLIIIIIIIIICCCFSTSFFFFFFFFFFLQVLDEKWLDFGNVKMNIRKNTFQNTSLMALFGEKSVPQYFVV